MNSFIGSRRIATVIFWASLISVLISACYAATPPPPGQLKNIYTSDHISFRYPDNWQVLAEGEQDVMIGSPDAWSTWNQWERVSNRKNDVKYVEHRIQSHGMYFGGYIPNSNTLDGAADELLGRFSRKYETFTYGKVSVRASAPGYETLQRDFFVWDWVMHGFLGTTPMKTTKIQANGIVMFLKHGETVWYWCFFAPGEATIQKQYLPTFGAILDSITINGQPLDRRSPQAAAVVNALRKPSASDIARTALQSVVLINVTGRTSAIGSGFVVRPGIVATNYHVIEGATAGYVSLPGDDRKYRIAGSLAVDTSADLALLQIEELAAPPLVLAVAEPQVGDAVYAVGNPEGLKGTFSQGIVSGIRSIDGQDLLQITAAISPGSSGGPIIGVDNRVIGIAVGSWRRGQNLNFIVPSSKLVRLLNSIGPLMPLSRMSKR